MLKTLMVTTAVGGLMIGSAMAQSSPPSSMDRPAGSPPAATDTTRPSSGDMNRTPPAASTTSPSTDANRSAATAPATSSGSVQAINSQKPDQLLASKLKGADVLGADDHKIGDVSDILLDKSGKVEAFIVSVGGFLGLGSKEVALPPNSFQMVQKDNDPNDIKLKVSMTKDQLTQAANFEKYNAPRTTTGMAPNSNSSTSRPASPAPAAPAPAQQSR
jgi:sporulation protein YlmC with PRC-barrel domain